MQRDERLAIIRGLPKVELHRHLEGSLRWSTIVEYIRESTLELPLAYLVSAQNMDSYKGEELKASGELLEKLREVCFCSYRNLERITQEAVLDAASEGVVHLELTFNPQKLTCENGLQVLGVMEAVAESGFETASECGIGIRLIVTFSREYFDQELWKRTIDLAADLSNLGVAGIDLPQDEYPRMFNDYEKIVRRAYDTGVLGVTVHMGVCADPRQVFMVVDELGAHRIGHGLTGADNEQVIGLLVDREAALVMCPISDFQTGLINNFQQHPLPLLDQAGVTVTINANDPTTQNTTINDEYDMAITRWGYDLDDLLRLECNAVRACFLSAEEQKDLLDRVETGYQECRDQGLF